MARAGLKSRSSSAFGRGLPWAVAFLCLVVSLTLPTIPGSAAQQPISLTVSAAISLKEALDDFGHSYEHDHPGVTIRFNYGGSGTLQHQIEQGAPVDVFLSAAEKQMDTLQSEGAIDTGSRRDFIGNSLVLIVPIGANDVTSFRDLSSAKARVIALGEPESVPAGMYAQQSLERLGIFDAVRAKAVYAKDVRQVLTYVEMGNADAGIVYQTDAKGSSKIRIVATAPASSHDPIVYAAAAIKNSKNPAAAREFLKTLTQAKALAIFQKIGFVPLEKPAEHP